MDQKVVQAAFEIMKRNTFGKLLVDEKQRQRHRAGRYSTGKNGIRVPATCHLEGPKAGSRLPAATGKKEIDSVVQCPGATRYGESNYS